LSFIFTVPTEIVLDQLDIEDVVNHFTPEELLKHIPRSEIKRYLMENPDVD
jgi:hypothetical protein